MTDIEKTKPLLLAAFLVVCVFMVPVIAVFFAANKTEYNTPEEGVLQVIDSQNLTEKATIYYVKVNNRRFVVLNSTNGVSITKY